MGEFAVVTEIRDNPRVVCVRTTGYIDDAAGEKIKKVIQSLMVKGEKNYLFNFAGSPVINSTGISCLLEVCEEIGFSLQGKVVFCCLQDDGHHDGLHGLRHGGIGGSRVLQVTARRRGP